MKRELHLPADFDARDDVRRLGVIFREIEAYPNGTRMGSIAVVLKLWLDWGRVGAEWRALEGESFIGDPLTVILEEYCGWAGDRGMLMTALMRSGVVAIRQDGERRGLVLNDFWRFNAHLDPEFKTMQQLGAEAKGMAARMKKVDAQARAAVEIRVRQGRMDFDAPADEVRRATALVMRLDIACENPVRPTLDDRLLRAAISVVRNASSDDVMAVCEFLKRNRRNTEVVKVPERIVESFASYLLAAVNSKERHCAV